MRKAVRVSAVLLAACLSGVWPAATAGAGEADVVAAEAEREPGGTWRFTVTLRHDDEGWDHYADAWQVLAPDGGVLATRELLHPHVEEQPFTRSLGGVRLPEGLDRVTLRGRDSRHGTGGAEIELELPEASGS